MLTTARTKEKRCECSRETYKSRLCQNGFHVSIRYKEPGSIDKTTRTIQANQPVTTTQVPSHWGWPPPIKQGTATDSTVLRCCLGGSNPDTWTACAVSRLHIVLEVAILNFERLRFPPLSYVPISSSTRHLVGSVPSCNDPSGQCHLKTASQIQSRRQQWNCVSALEPRFLTQRRSPWLQILA